MKSVDLARTPYLDTPSKAPYLGVYPMSPRGVSETDTKSLSREILKKWPTANQEMSRWLRPKISS